MPPRDQWGRFDQEAVVLPLDLDREVRTWGEAATAHA